MIHVLYENPAWLPPLAAALEARGLPWEARDVSEGDFHVEGDIPPGVWLNRMSPSAHTRGHAGGIHFVREWLGVLEERVLVLPTQARKDQYLKVHPEFRAIFTSNHQRRRQRFG